MSFKDILKKSFLENYAQTGMSIKTIIIAIALTCVFAVYIYLFYRIVTKKSFYSKSFNISLASIAIITSAIILTIQSSVVVSLGMVGALSIVRFRTAIKDPMDLVFLFWSIAVGIICGSGLFGIALVLSASITILILVLELVPQAKAPQILLISFKDSDETNDGVDKILTDSKSYYNEKSRTITNGQISLAFEIRTSDGRKLCSSLSGLEGLNSVSLLKHDCEVTY